MSVDQKIESLSRRSFLGGLGATAAGLLVPSYLLANPSSTIRIPITKEMAGHVTANVLMGYVADVAGVNLGKHITDDARKYMTVEFGEKTPRAVYVGANSLNIALSDQLAWRTTEAGAKTFKHTAKIERTPQHIDYLFPGDTVLFDTSAMGRDGQEILSRFGGGTLPKAMVELDNLKAYASKKFGRHVDTQKEAIAKLGIASERKQRYTNMDNLEFMVREVSKGVADDMYKGLADQGVSFRNPAEHLAEVGPALAGPEHRAGQLGQIYLAVGYNRFPAHIEANPCRKMEDGKTTTSPCLSPIGGMGYLDYADLDQRAIGYTFSLRLRANSERELAELVGKNMVDEAKAKASVHNHQRMLVQPGQQNAKDLFAIAYEGKNFRELMKSGKIDVVNERTQEVMTGDAAKIRGVPIADFYIQPGRTSYRSHGIQLVRS